VTPPDPNLRAVKGAGRERGRERRGKEKGRKGIGGKGGSQRIMGIDHPLFSA